MQVSSSYCLSTGVPQDSVLGTPLLSILTTCWFLSPAYKAFSCHCYANGTQLFLSFPQDYATQLVMQALLQCPTYRATTVCNQTSQFQTFLPEHPHPGLQTLSPTLLDQGTVPGGPYITQQKNLSKTLQPS